MKTLILISLLIASQVVASAQNCDRACLHNTITAYLNTLVTHNPGALPLAANVRFTEDSVERKLGEGLWTNVTRLHGYRQEILDVRQGFAGAHVVIEVAGKPALLVVRLSVDEKKKITEIETMVTRDQAEGARLFEPAALQTPSAEMIRAISDGQRNTREEASRIAQLYPVGLKAGSFVTAKIQFARDAYRFENGRLMAGLACTFAKGCNDLKGQRIPALPEIKSRLVAVDEELGIVWLRMDFGAGSVPGQAQSTLVVWEMFKVYDDKIHAVEAFMKVMPRGTPSGWE